MNNLLIELLNTILTNTLEYQEVLRIFSKSVSNIAIKNKINERIRFNDLQVEVIIGTINTLNGKKGCKRQKPSKEIISWISSSLPHPQNLPAVLTCLIRAEQNLEKNYTSILNKIELDSDSIVLFEKPRTQISANIIYFKEVMDFHVRNLKNQPHGCL